MELRPPGFDGEHAGHFCVDFAQILPTGEEIFEGVKVVAKAVQGKIKLTGKPWKKRQRDGTDAASVHSASLKIWVASWILLVAVQKWIRYD